MPGHAPGRAAHFAERHGSGRCDRADREAPRRRDRRPRRPRGGAAVTAIAEPRHERGPTPRHRSSDGFDLAELAAQHGTPFYLYDLDVVERRVRALLARRPARRGSTSPSRSRPTRRWPCSPRLAALGLGADVASGGELDDRHARRASRRSRIVFTGPGKRDAELEAALSQWASAPITVESLDELGSLIERRDLAGPRPGVAPSHGRRWRGRGPADHRRTWLGQVRPHCRRSG